MKPSVFDKLKSKFKLTSSSHKEIEGDLAWLKENYTRDDAESFLIDKEIGTFVIRKSETISDCFVLSVKVPRYINYTTLSHYLIDKRKKEYKLRGCKQSFESLTTLVMHCAYIRDVLPTLLNIAYYKPELRIPNTGNSFNEFLYYSSGSSIGSSVFDTENDNSQSSLSSSSSIEDTSSIN